MPRIKNIEIDGNITNDDKLLGSDVDGTTKNFSVGNLASFFQSTQFVFNQSSASTTWTIAHNLNKFPSVVIKFSTGEYTNVGAIGGVTYTDANNLTINLAAAESGVAYLN
jgi:hypothetical protein|tara:strand:+ start:2366 stop:2695 length:330 start_codon:yes stop_codon:yes gene_type:complete